MKNCDCVVKLPFGEDLSTPQRTAQLGYQVDTVKQKFTGYQKDDESGLDFAQERYYASNHGRFTSADPIPMTSQRPSDPQKLNLYAYVRNNPLLYTDKNGLEIDATGSEADRYVRDLEAASGLKLKRDSKTGKISIVSAPKKLSKDGKQIQKIINDTKNVVKVEAIRDTAGTQPVLVGQFNGNGSQTIDYDDIDKFGAQRGGSTSQSIITHETTEAYEGLTNKAALADPKGPFAASHEAAIGYENSYRGRTGLGARVEKNQTVTQSGNDVTLTIDFTTHREKITIDRTNPNQIKSVQVEKKKP